nr:ribonuclease H-like domain-containing protein [Tanacetum cinerariifolium]
MESLSPQVVSAAKLLILNPNEFDLWKMRIEQYFLMTDYSLWEVILNGDTPLLTRVIEGVVLPLAPTTAEQRLARKNEFKARGTLLMALTEKHQLKFNTHKDAKTLMKAIEKRFGGNKETKKVQKTLLKQQFENFTGSSSESLYQIHDRLQKLISQLEILGNKIDLEDQSLDDLFNSLKIYEAEVQSSSSASTFTPNIAFVSSQNPDNTNESVSAVTSVTAASAKVPVYALPNVDTLINAMAMLTMRARRFLQWTGRNLGANETTSMGFDMSKVECYNCHERGHFARECRSPKDTKRNVPKAMTGAFRQKKNQPTMHLWHSPPQVLPVLIMREKALVALRMKFEKAKQERDELRLQLEKFQTSLKNLSKLLASQTNDKIGLGYDNQVFTSSMFDCDDMLSFESNVSLPASLIYDRSSVKTVEHPILAETHRKASPKTRNHRSSRNRKACFVCKSLNYLIKECDYFEKKMVQQPVKIHAMRGPNQHYASLTNSQPHRHSVPTSVLTKSRLVPLTATRPVNVAVSQPHVTRPRPVKHVVTKSHSPPRRTINRRPYLNLVLFLKKLLLLKLYSLSPGPQSQENVPQEAGTVTTSNELDFLFSSMFDELLNGSTQVVSKSSAETTADAPNQCQQQHITPLNTQTKPEPTCQVPTQAPTVTSIENINQAETITEDAQGEDDEFINIFCTPVQDRGETSSRHVDSSN